MVKSIIRLLIRTLMMINIAEAMRFDLKSGQKKCISEEIKTNSMTVGKYSIYNPNDPSPLPQSYKIIVKVTSPYGSTYHYGDQVVSGNFAFTAAESGDYTTCFWIIEQRHPVLLPVEFDWRTGVAAKDWSDVAKKGQIEIMELQLRKLYETVTAIHDEIFYLREREEEMQRFNRATNVNITSLGFLSIVVCVSVAAMQLWHLKSYFERKKLL